LFRISPVILIRNDADGEFLFFRTSESDFGRESRASPGLAWERCPGNRLENGTLACGLISDDDNLGELDIVELGKLEFVNQVKEASLLVGEVLAPQRCADREWISGPTAIVSGDEL
jgi:hypothetical protein